MRTSRRERRRVRVTRQATLARAVRVAGPGLHTGRRAVVTLAPAPAGHGRRFARAGNGAPTPTDAVPMSWAHWAPSRMSTSLDGGGGQRLRTIEHLMAALSAHAVDNVLVTVDGGELPIFDGSAARWCRAMREAGTVAQDAPRRALRIRAPVQVARDGGFLRVEPAAAFAVDVTHDLLPAFPVMRWRGPLDAATFDAELARSRSFGNLHRRLGLTPRSDPRPAGDPAVAPNAPDPAVGTDEAVWNSIAAHPVAVGEPLLRGWRPWRAALVAGRRVLPWPRWPDEPVRHVALDMIGDLALAGAPIIGRVVAHNPSHVKTYALVAALMARPACWEAVDAPAP